MESNVFLDNQTMKSADTAIIIKQIKADVPQIRTLSMILDLIKVN